MTHLQRRVEAARRAARSGPAELVLEDGERRARHSNSQQHGLGALALTSDIRPRLEQDDEGENEEARIRNAAAASVGHQRVERPCHRRHAPNLLREPHLARDRRVNRSSERLIPRRHGAGAQARALRGTRPGRAPRTALAMGVKRLKCDECARARDCAARGKPQVRPRRAYQSSGTVQAKDELGRTRWRRLGRGGQSAKS